MFYGYLQAAETEGASIAMECFQHAKHSIVSITEPTIIGPKEQVFKIKDFQMAGKCYFCVDENATFSI